MNATNRAMAPTGLALFSVLALAATGCRTHVVHERTRTVYVPPPPPVVHVPPAPAPAPVVYVPPVPAPQPPPVVVVTPPVQPPVVVIQAENDFYEPLAAHGRWVVVGSYGRCWIPGQVEVGWRPYSNGYWQRTDAGWYWVSDEPWGWATYHYGRWDFHAQFGWIWVPHTQWAPAWVCWREGGGYVGWAPLRPSVTIGVHLHHVDYEPAFASRAFVFVEHRRMLEPVRPKTVIVNNTTIINKTVNITNVKVVNKTVINEGPRPEVIERASGRKVQAVPAHEFRRREETTVAVRKRTAPAAVEKKLGPPVRTETRPAPTRAATPQHVSVAEKPAVTQNPSVTAAPSARPPVAPSRPMSPPRNAVKPVTEENKRAAETAGPTSPPNISPPATVEQKPATTAVPQREPRRVEKPIVPVKPATEPVMKASRRNETRTGAEIANPAAPEQTPVPLKKTMPELAREVLSQREIRPDRKPTGSAKPTPHPATPVAESRSRNAVSPASSLEVKASAAPAARTTPAKTQSTPPRERPAAVRQLSPKPASQTNAQPEATESKSEIKNNERSTEREGQENRPNSNRPSR